MLEEKLYTVADVADITGLTSRTIRNYLKEGVLKGHKIGVQWRFTEEEIRLLFTKQIPQQNTPTQLVKKFMGEQQKDRPESCFIIDFPGMLEETGRKLYGKSLDYVKEKELETLLSYECYDDQKLFRIALSGPIHNVGIIQEYIWNEYTQLTDK